jgi:hypothetical protein
MELRTLLYAILPFLIGIIFKLFTYLNGGRVQEEAIQEMVAKRTPPVLTSGQIAVVVKTANFATRSLTAASTLITSLLALLILALKYPYPLIWGFFGFDVLLALFVWIKVARHRGSWEVAWNVKIGEFLMLMSFVIDAVGVTASAIATSMHT